MTHHDYDRLEDWLRANRARHLEELFDLLRIPSVSTSPAHRADVLRCAEHVRDRVAELGLTARVMPTDGYPVVYGEWLGAPGAPTVLIYGHYDVQPAEPLELWRSPPFEPTLEDGTRIVARGATDDKGQFYCYLKGIEAHMRVRGALPCNVRVIIEGEEEIGSPNLRPFLERHRELLQADAILVSDTSMHGPDQPSIMYALRGLAYLEVTVRGPSHDLHSGLYGGAVPNPIHALAGMLAALHDADGRVCVPGFHDRVRSLSDAERAEMAALAGDEQAFCAEVGIPFSTGEAGYNHLERTTARPTLECNGIWGGWTGDGAKTVLPSLAHAKISCRLVADQDPDEITSLVADHLRRIAPPGVEVDVRPHHGGRPYTASREGVAVQAAGRALEHVWGRPPVFTRGGGSIPIVADFRDVLGLDTVLVGFGLTDDRLHSPNEKFELRNYEQGIRTTCRLLEELGRGAAAGPGEAG